MAYLRIFLGDTLLEQRELNAVRTTIGRGKDNDIVLGGRGVSKHHAVIEHHDDAFELVDCSSNGTFVGGSRVERRLLKYWDEIQIYNYVLRFMAVARARGEEAGAPAAGDHPTQEETMELDIASLGDLARLKRRIKVASLMLFDEHDIGHRYALDKVNFLIGKSVDSDIGVRGWLAPRIAARIQRRNDGFYLLPGARGRVRLNGGRVRRQSLLHDGDRFSVRGLSLQFLYRPQDDG
ncbi:MAG: FHA domain-containing protein [Chromatiaceae bacterium]|nr:FHA domain-containing protein [Gammaproteobacteria bacterium]MCP5300658.1 FHA domain-containing protein [Chromatiaceae bacterium]MCP5422730.1 FHA domain-containing protein [Chromatiaceae bacterium]